MEKVCEHLHQERRIRTHSNGTTHLVLQCQTCGIPTRSLKKVELGGQAESAIPAFNPQIETDFARVRSAKSKAVRDVETQEFFDWYGEYLKTPAWRAKRQLVLQRAKGVCEGCAAQKATQVHHTTYAHVGDEFLWELIAICDTCHERVTDLDRQRRAS